MRFREGDVVQVNEDYVRRWGYSLKHWAKYFGVHYEVVTCFKMIQGELYNIQGKTGYHTLHERFLKLVPPHEIEVVDRRRRRR